MRLTTTQTKILVAMLLILITALTTTAALTYLIYERTLSAQVMSRFEFLALELKRKVEAGLDLGLPLGQLDNIHELLRMESATEEALVSLSILNNKGKVLFDTDPAQVGSRRDMSWLGSLEALSTGAVDVHKAEGEIGVPIANSFGKVVGALLVTYSKTFYDNKRHETARHLINITVVVFLVGGIIGFAGVLSISRPLEHVVIRLEAGLHAILVRIGRPIERLDDDTEIDADIASFEHNLQSAVAALEQAEASLSAAAQSGPRSP